MPIYEYSCEDCGKVSEILVRENTLIACRHCGSRTVKKKLSSFAMSSPSSALNTAPSCAPSCGGGFQQGACGSGGCCGGKHRQ